MTGIPTSSSSELAPMTAPRSYGGASRILAETGLSLGTGFAADAVYRTAARGGRSGAALCIGLVAAAGIKALGEGLLAETLGPGPGRTTGEAMLDGLRTGVIDGALGIGARRLHNSVVGRLPARTGTIRRTAVTGSVMGGIGATTYAATDHRTWQRGFGQGLADVGGAALIGAAGGLLLGGVSGAIAEHAPGLVRGLLRRSPAPATETIAPTPAPAVKPIAPPLAGEPVPVVAEIPIPAPRLPVVEPVAAPGIPRSQRRVIRPQGVTGAVAEGAGGIPAKGNTLAAQGAVSPGAAPIPNQAINPAFKGDPYHPETVEARIRLWRQQYATPAAVPTRMTRSQAIAAAERLGFQPTNYTSHGQPVFRNGNQFITPDVDAHCGGVWKMADSARNLGSKTTRLGTFDAELNRIAD